MSEKKNHEVVKNYSLYVTVHGTKKTVKDKSIQLYEDKNHVGGERASSPVEHIKVKEMSLLIMAIKGVAGSYAFKLMCKDICAKPFFRFDAAGATHTNPGPETELPLRQITPPHFQYYNNQGYNIAYKTEDLKDPALLDGLSKDINAGITVFCKECNTFVADGTYPQVIRVSPPIPIGKTPFDHIEF